MTKWCMLAWSWWGAGAIAGCLGADQGTKADEDAVTDAATTAVTDAAPTLETTSSVPSDVATDVGSETEGAQSNHRFSFFVTSLAAMRAHSGSDDGFGGNLGGLAGADALCQAIAAEVGAGDRTWRAFLSATDDGTGKAVHAIERIGPGPWYDAFGRLVASDVDGLLGERPDADGAIINDLPDENGVPVSAIGDGHDIMTGSDKSGRLASTNRASTCNDWTSADAIGGRSLMCGHSFPRRGGGGGPGGGDMGKHWMSDHALPGCTPGVVIEQNGPAAPGATCVGCAGGYGAIYCFAVTP